MRKELPMLITVLSALAILFAKFFYLGTEWNLAGTLDRWVVTSSAFAFYVGVVNLTIIHGRNIARRRDVWPYSVVLLGSLYIYFIIGMVQTTTGTTFLWIYNNMMVPLGSTFMGTIAFFITSAAYRAFRVRTREATVLMIACIIVMMGTAPIGDAIWSGWGGFKDWFLNVPNTGAMRGITIGALLGSMAVGLRIMLGLERAHIGGTGTQ